MVDVTRDPLWDRVQAFAADEVELAQTGRRFMALAEGGDDAALGPVWREQVRETAGRNLRDACMAASELATELARARTGRWRDAPEGVQVAVSAVIAALAGVVPGQEGICWAIRTPDSDLDGAVARLREAVAAVERAVTPLPPAERRNALMYRLYKEGKTLKEIRAEVNARAEAEGWESLGPLSAVLGAIRRYAESKGIPNPKARRRGRPRNSVPPEE